MLETLLYIIFFLSCLVLIVVVLLQPGKADAGALFTSNISSTAFGPRGTASVLSRITIGAATIFMVSALLLAMPAIRGEVSVLNSTGTTSTTETTNPPVNPGTNETNSNTAVVVPSDVNNNVTAVPTTATDNTNTAVNK
jgi:preprotein translocase subunit SecG